MRLLTLDLSTRDVGWACDIGRGSPAYGLFKLPGMSNLGQLYAATRNMVEALILDHDPEGILFCQALFRDRQTAARALAGVQATTELVAYDNSIECWEANEPRARKAVLGRGTFADKNPDYAQKKPDGTRDQRMWINGTKNAKLAVMGWAARMGYAVPTHDVADALLLLRYGQIMQEQRVAPRDWR